MTMLAASVWDYFSHEDLARWAILLSALSLVGVIWIVQNMYKLARNQVKLGLMLEELLKR